MIFLTSISPNKKSYILQKNAIDTWEKYGNIYSVNTDEEIELLSENFQNVKFISNNKTSKYKYNKDYMFISDIILKFRELKIDDDICFINSDISIFGDFSKILEFKGGLLFCSRWNYDKDINQCELEKYGFDIFVFNSKYIDIFSDNDIYAMGVPWWDYWFPYTFKKNNINTYYFEDKLFYHKKHDINWNQNLWLTNLKKFYGEFNYIKSNPASIPLDLKNKSTKI
jgi:hypothetical protein